MSLKALPIPALPEEIARAAHTAFHCRNVFMQLRDTLGAIYTNKAFAELFPLHGLNEQMSLAAASHCL